MRFFIMTDMEGVSGVVDFDRFCNAESVYYEKAKRLTTLEVNAAVEGILSTGSHEVVVCDGHGGGALDIELLHKEASLIMGSGLKLMFEMDHGHYDAFLMVGQHAMKNAPGSNLGHTFDHINIISLTINGLLIGEAGVNALRAGIFDVPAIYLSGDEAACSEAESIIPGIYTCAVKRGISTTSAECLAPEKVRDKIRESVGKAVTNFSHIKPYRLQAPYEAIYEFASAKSLAGYTDKAYCSIGPGNTVHIHADTIEELLERKLWGL